MSSEQTAIRQSCSAEQVLSKWSLPAVTMGYPGSCIAVTTLLLHKLLPKVVQARASGLVEKNCCDIDMLPNQTYLGTSKPLAALPNGDPSYGSVLSYLPGQWLSACTFPGESHPIPVHANGDYVGCSEPENDIFERQLMVGLARFLNRCNGFHPS
ncbi:hypothetical protein DEU56DRAFT_242726 [Suillus clintonianus]|uniref:uncharacterized protein n=1 Tax=Suillus clintonianus TaxID=1904413 RepID=UPI001B88474C|nr:uncharacterized protein DEU56DRAFT_242726 [Suillus clintonianus]KAG2143588.1 hypothetical protein DEU56DRAFT_242726 [Suillus clintonianus]